MDTPLEWFKWFAGTPDHVKTKRLARALGHPMAGVFWLAKLWALVARYCPADGVFEGRLGREEIEESIGWTGEPGALVAALVACRFLDQAPLRAHQWQQWQPGIMEARELGKRATDRAVERRDSNPDDAKELAPSQYFLNWWALVPLGKRKGIRPAYKAWRAHGLDDPGPAGENLRGEISRVFGLQLNNATWRREFDERGTALSYMRKRDWLGFSMPAAPEAPAAPVLQMPAQRDETDLRRDWQGLPSSDGREWPGYDQALREVMRAMGKGPN